MTTHKSIAGFIVKDPVLEKTRKGEPRFYARIGMEHWDKNKEGKLVKLENSYHDLVLYDRAAEVAYGRFRPGDNFIAHGDIETYGRVKDGQTLQFEKFRAWKIGHDAARTNYVVDRSRRQNSSVQDRDLSVNGHEAAPVNDDPDGSRERAPRKLPPVDGQQGRKSPAAVADQPLSS